MRTFTLINENGQKYDLNALGSGFLFAPSGLGYTLESSYSRIGSMWVRNSQRDAQKEIAGTIIFGGLDPYGLMAVFAKFVRESKNLKLQYETTAGAYLRNVDIVDFSKSELKSGKVLECAVKMKCKSLWYMQQLSKFVIRSSGARGTRYPFRFTSRYRDYSNGVIDLSNDGSVGAAFTCSIEGAISNPSLILSDSEKEIYRIDIYGDAELGERIEYSSVDGDLYCKHVSADGTETNLTPGLSLENANFFKIPVGDFKLSITADSTITQPVTVTMNKVYRAV